MLQEKEWLIVLQLALVVVVLCLLILLLVLFIRQHRQITGLFQRLSFMENGFSILEQTLNSFVKQQSSLKGEDNHTETSQEAADVDDKDDNPDSRFQERVMALIVANYADPAYTPARLIDDMGMSRSLFHRKSTALLGQPAGRLINSYRMEKSKELMLSHDNMNISEVAYAVGFNDPKYFTRYFTKYYGCSPRKMTLESK